MDSPPTTPSTPTSIRLRRQRGRTPPPPLLVAGPLLGCVFALALLLLLSHGVTGASAIDTGAGQPRLLRSVPRRLEEEAVAVPVPIDGGADQDKAFSLTERTRPAALGGDPNSGELLNFGHNEHVMGVRKHHPTVRAVWGEVYVGMLGFHVHGRADDSIHTHIYAQNPIHPQRPIESNPTVKNRPTPRWPSTFFLPLCPFALHCIALLHSHIPI